MPATVACMLVSCNAVRSGKKTMACQELNCQLYGRYSCLWQAEHLQDLAGLVYRIIRENCDGCTSVISGTYQVI